MKSRIALAMLLVFAAALVGPGSARAIETPAITIDKMLQTGQPGYYEPGDSITYRYQVGGNDRFINVEVTDDMCAPVTPVLGGGPGGAYNIGDTIAPYGALNGLGPEVWVYTCTTSAPVGANETSSSTNTGHVEAISPTPGCDQFQGITWEDDDTFTLTGIALYKAVFLFWNYNVGIPDPGAGDVLFNVDVKNGSTVVGTETVSVNNALKLWMAPGISWTLKEQTPPAGYRVFDGRDTWSPNLVSDRANAFINGADFDLAIQKSGPDISFGSVTYEYTVTNTGPGVVTPVVTDNKCAPVTYFSGDTALNPGKIDPTETWTFKCTYTPNWGAAFPTPLTNTATVVAGEADDLSPAYDGGPIFGGDTCSSNNTDTFTLYPFILRKDVGGYTGNDPFWPYQDNTTFSVKAFKCTGNPLVCVEKATFMISENSPKQMWLAAGTWKFQEYNLPPAYLAFYDDATITFVTGTYPDWSQRNVREPGCSLGFWKNHTPWPGSYTPGQTLASAGFITGTLGNYTLQQALEFPGGSGTVGGQQILLKQAVAALLNEQLYGAHFGPYASTAALISAVNTALAGSRGGMTSLASTLDYWNNGFCQASS